MKLTTKFDLISVIPIFEGCDQTRQGCRIQEGSCLCGVGCYSEYRYSNYDECHKALKGTTIYHYTYIIFWPFSLEISGELALSRTKCSFCTLQVDDTITAHKDRAIITVFAFKLHKTRDTSVDVRALVTTVLDVT